ncbi:MAG TPA: ABC transporter substrate-binding protein [Jatrophihabitantaceae bacterium]|nr:ABC transporter substrate-binding protein [Jatrophihabitantaceae bacterium]
MKAHVKVRSRWFLASCIVAAAATVLAGCSSSGNGGSSSGGKTTMSLKIGQISNSVAFFPIFVARQEGYFTDEGLSVNSPTLLGTGAKLAAALVSGSIDVGGGVMTDAFNIANANQKAKVISNLVNAYYVDIIVGKNVPTPGPGASLTDKIKALKGKTIGITGPGSGTSALVAYLFKQAGMDPAKDATLVNLGAQATAVLGALKTGRVDALSFFQPIGQEAEAQNIGSIYISPARGDIPAMANETHGVVMASDSALANKKKAVTAFIKGIARAEQTIHGDPTAVGKLLSQYETNLDAATVKAMVPVLQKEIPTTPAVSQQSYQVAVDFHKTAGLVPNPPSYDSLVDASLISAATG